MTRRELNCHLRVFLINITHQQTHALSQSCAKDSAHDWRMPTVLHANCNYCILYASCTYIDSSSGERASARAKEAHVRSLSSYDTSTPLATHLATQARSNLIESC